MLYAEQRQHASARRTGIGDALLRTVEHQRCHAGCDATGTPCPTGLPVPAADDVGLRGPPGVRLVEVAAGQLVTEREDLRRVVCGPPHNDRAHVVMLPVRGSDILGPCRSTARRTRTAA